MKAPGVDTAEFASVIAGVATVGAVLVLALIARPAAAPARRPAGVTGAHTAARRMDRRLVGAAWIVVALAALATVGAIGSVLLGGVVVALTRRRRRTTGRLEQGAIDAALPDATELFVLCIHAGRSPTQAIGELAERAPLAVRAGFVAVELQLHRGSGLADALGELPRHLGPAARELAAAVATADREGLPLAPMLDRLAADARAARRRAGEAAARTLPVRLAFPLVVCTLPAFVLLAIAPAVLGALSTLRGDAP